MRRITVLSTVLALALTLVLFGTSPSVHAGGAPDPIKTALQQGGDRLDALQNPDGGWFWYVGDIDCGAGPGVSCPNTIGITAMGVLQAYLVTKDLDHLVAAADAGDLLVAKHNAAPACDSLPGTSADRPFTVDVTFLMELSKVAKPSGKTYKTAATAWFQCVMKDFPSAADRANNRIDGRIGQGYSNLGEWDAALDIEAALAVGQKKYAEAEALQVIARQADWDVADPDCPGCDILGKGLLMHVLKSIGNTTVKAAIADWTADLVFSQDPAGSWAGDTQTTAYALMGLSAVKKTSAVKNAINKGLLYLFGEAIGNGGFFVGTGSTDENTEVDSEVLQALYIFR